MATVNEIINDGKFNQNSYGEEVPGITDKLGQKWTKINDVYEIEAVSHLLSADSLIVLNKRSSRKNLINALKNNVIVCFYFDLEDKLNYEY